MSADRILSAEETGDSPVRHALRRLSVYLRRNAVFYTVWSALTLAYVAAFIALPILVGWAISGGLDPDVTRREFLGRCGLLFAVAIVRAGLRFASRLLVFNAAREIEYEMRNDLFAHLQRLPQSFYFD